MLNNKAKIVKLVAINTAKFLFISLFVNVFIALFGGENALVGVAIVVALMMLPDCDLGIKSIPMTFVIAAFFMSVGVFAALSVVNPWLGILINFSFIFLTMLISCEPVLLKPYICLLLCYIFCQTAPVHGHELVMRIVGLMAGGLLISVTCLIKWRKNGLCEARSLPEQVSLSAKNYSFILRMAGGIATAMFVAAMLHLDKPLWISIVVMSLTQLKIDETLQRIKYRAIATVLGIALFICVFQLLIPTQYAFVLVLLMGYLCTYIKAYKYTQIINAISAINASLVLMDTTTAIENRLLCLAGGILIVLCFYVFDKLARIRRFVAV